MEYENTESMDGALVEAEESSEILEVVSEAVQPTPKIDPNAACNVRRKIEDHLERKRYREQQGEEFNLDELIPA